MLLSGSECCQDPKFLSRTLNCNKIKNVGLILRLISVHYSSNNKGQTDLFHVGILNKKIGKEIRHFDVNIHPRTFFVMLNLEVVTKGYGNLESSPQSLI